MTSQIICDVTTALLKYGKYIEKLKLAAQAVYVQIMMICTVSCVNKMIGVLCICNSMVLSAIWD